MTDELQFNTPLCEGWWLLHHTPPRLGKHWGFAMNREDDTFYGVGILFKDPDGFWNLNNPAQYGDFDVAWQIYCNKSGHVPPDIS